jgi:hypothetical protein
VHPHHDRLFGVQGPEHQGELFRAGRLVAKNLRLPFAPGQAVEGCRGDPLDQMVAAQAIGDQVADSADLEPVRAGELDQVVERPWSRPRA